RADSFLKLAPLGCSVFGQRLTRADYPGLERTRHSKRTLRAQGSGSSSCRKPNTENRIHKECPMAQIAPPRPSMNEAHDQDPFNTARRAPRAPPRKRVYIPRVLAAPASNGRIPGGCGGGRAEREFPADLSLARSLVPAGTATLRDFSNIAPEIPVYITENCTGCMDCVTECPDTAILGKVLSETELEDKLKQIPEADRAMYKEQWSKTKKYYDAGKKKVGVGGMFQIIIDPSKCKGCAECVTVCDDDALKMVAKSDDLMTKARKSHRYFKNIGPSN